MNINKYMYLEERFLPRLTSLEIKDIDKQDALIILPIGATEQHGPHLPVYTDAILVESMLDAGFSFLNKEENIWTLPTIPYGKSNEHMNRAGTFTLSFETLKSIVLDVCRSVRENGFRKLVLFNGHGGNIDTLKIIARDVRIETGIMVFIIHIGNLTVPEEIISKEELLLGIHGGDYETSLLMSSYPNWVNHNKLSNETPKLLEESNFLRFQKGNFAWTIDDVSVSGTLGNATIATKEKGNNLYNVQGKELAEIFLDIKAFESSKLIRE